MKDVEIKNIDHLGIVAGIIDSIGLVEIINESIGVNENEKVNAGQVVKAMILNGSQSGNGVADKRVDMTYDAASQLKGINRYADLAGTQLVADSSYDYDVASRLKELKHFKGTDVLAAYGFD
nr:DUF4277 domain-containing protein [Rivularia sp. PCC 7116]